MTGRPRLYGSRPSHKIGVVLPVDSLAVLDRVVAQNDGASRSTILATLLDNLGTKMQHTTEFVPSDHEAGRYQGPDDEGNGRDW